VAKDLAFTSVRAAVQPLLVGGRRLRSKFALNRSRPSTSMTHWVNDFAY